VKARIALGSAAPLVLLFHTARFAETWTDDAFITFRYARHLAEGVGMAFNPGDRLEGLTNIGWAILLAPFSSGDLLTIAQRAGVLASVGTVLLLLDWCACAGVSVLGTFTALALVVGMPWVPYWAMQGLETPIVLFLTTLAWTRYARELAGGPPIAALALAAAPWIRPDAALLCIVVAAWHLRRPGPRFSRPALVAGALGVTSALALVALKLHWFGAILPNTFAVKVDHFPPERGLWYLWHFLTLPTPLVPALVIAGVVVGLQRARDRDDRGLPGVLAFAYIAAVTLQNGDIFADYRLLVPVWPAAAAAAALAVDEGVRRAGRFRAGAAFASLGFLAALAVGVVQGFRFGAVDHLDSDDPWNVVRLNAAPWAPWKAWSDGGRPRDQMPFPATWALANAGPEDTVAYSELGLIGWLVDGPVLDMLGLTDPLMAAGGERAWEAQHAHVQETAGAVMIMVQAGLWARWHDTLAADPWSLDAACGGTWVFRNASVPLHPPDAAELDRRYDAVLRRTPRMTSVLLGFAAELVAAGRTDEAARWLDRVEAAGALDSSTLQQARCRSGIGEGCAVQPWCEAFDQRLSPAQVGDPSRWPAPREALIALAGPEMPKPAPKGPAAPATPEVSAACQAIRAEIGGQWENLARDVPHVDLYVWVPSLARNAARTARAGNPELLDHAERTTAALERVGDPDRLAKARALAARSQEALDCR
jgi:hypothetical protein